MAGRFQDKVVLITGGASGIGAGCARVFQKEGAKAVIIIDCDQIAGNQILKELPRVRFAWQNVTSIEANGIGNTIHEFVEKEGQLDCLINNVGWHPEPTSLENFDHVDFQYLFCLNVTAQFVITQACLPYLKRSKGTIINMSSVVALVGENESAPYAATKAALNGATISWAIELAQYGIRVNAVAPSSVDTPLLHLWLNSSPSPTEAEAQEKQMHLIKRFATPEEIGQVCLFLATEATFITGQIVQVDGGCTLLHPRNSL